MEKMKIELKECCLMCEHFYLDTSSIGCYVSCGQDERKISCVHMPVCYIYNGENDEQIKTLDAPGQKASPCWTSVKDALPKDSGHYLVHFSGKDIFNITIGRYSPEKNKWRSAEAYSYFEEVTHWAPLPEPPK